MNLTKLAIHNNRTTLVLVFLLFISGVLAYFQLPKQQDPGFTIRAAVITTNFAGASPERVELLVTQKIEEKIQEMPEIDFITSESRAGVSVITVNFKESYKIMRPIFDDMRRKVEDIEEDLPAGIRGPFINDEFGDVFGSVYSLTGDGYSFAELKEAADEIRDQLLKQPDVAKVTIHGAQQEVVYIEYNNARLRELGLSPQQLSGILASVNIVSSGGNVLSGRERINLEPTGNFESIDDLRRTVIELPAGGVVYLSDIANVYRDYVDPPKSITRVNGEPAMAIAVSMRDGGDILKLGKQLDRLVPEIQARYPWGIELQKIWFQASLVETSVNNFASSLLQAIAIVVVVMILFLGLRTGLVVASLIPTAMVISFFVMSKFGISINQISLAALIIALGLLVDNAIVMVESVLVKREEGKSAIRAAIESGTELKMPLLISSLTTAAAFMPIALAESAVGEYTGDIFYVVTIALLCSWLLAMTFIPMLTTKTIHVEVREGNVDPLNGRWYQLYRNTLLAVLRHRGLFMLGVVAVFFVAMWAIRFVPAIFIEQSEDPVFSGKLEMPLGTSIETSQAIIADIDEFVEKTYYRPAEGEPLVENWMTFIGEGGPRFTLTLNPPNPNPANSFLIVNTINGGDVEQIIAGVEQYVFETYPDMAVQLSRLENGPPVGYPIQVRISGPDFEELFVLAEQVTGAIYELPGVTSIKNTWGLQTKKLLVDVSQERARRAGVTSDDVAYSLKASLEGIELTQYRDQDDLIPVKLRTVAADREDVNKLDGMSIYSQSSGSIVPLKQVADVRLVFEPGVIEHRDRERTLTLNVQLEAGVTAAEVNAVLNPWIEQASGAWPAGYRYAMGGEGAESGDANASIAAKLPLALMAILLLLVMQFNSIRRPLIILATIPLGMIGVTFGLLIAQSSMGFFTILGVISLSGIIINNAIVLIDRIKYEAEELQRPEHDAVVHACLQRLRPILLATATTVLGMLPLWWGGTAMFKPMAISIMFGLTFATMLTLFVVPVFYSLLFRLEYKNYEADQPALSESS